MAVVYFSGFEAGSAEPFYGAGGTYSIQTSIKKTGSYALKVNPTTTAIGYVLTFGLAAAGIFPNNAPVTSYTKFDFYYVTKAASNDEQIFLVRDYSSGLLKLEVRLDSTGVLKVYDKDAALVATGTTVLDANTWYRIEVRSGSGTSATYEVRINGVTELSGTCNQLVANAAGIFLGKETNRNGNSVEYYYDNYVVDDSTFPGACDVIQLLPTANGSTAQWTAGTGSSNYLEVDEVPTDGDTTYIQSTGGAGEVHLVTLQTLASLGLTGVVKSFKAMASLKEPSAVVSSQRIRIRSSSTNSDTTGYDGTTGYAWLQKIQNTNPSGGAAWTTAAIDAVEIGVLENNAVVSRCSTIYGAVLLGPANAGGLMMMGIGS